MDTRRRSVLRRALSVLECFEHGDADLTLAELTRRCGLPKPTVFRILGELADWGAVERSGGGYRLGVRIYMLGERVPAQTSLRDVAMPFLEDLYEATHENVNLGVLHGHDVLFLARVAGHRSSEVLLRVGDTLPAHSTSTGKVLLAFAGPEVVDELLAGGLDRLTPYTVVMPGMFRKQLHAIVRNGYAVNAEETHRGVVSVAAPVIGQDGRAVAAVSVTGRTGRVDAARLAPAVRTTALGISRALSAAASSSP